MNNKNLVGSIIHREKGTHSLVTVLVKRIELAKVLFRCHLTGNNRQLFLADGPEIYPLKIGFGHIVDTTRVVGRRGCLPYAYE